MSFLHSEDYDAFRESVARWVDKVVKPAVAKLDLDKPFMDKAEEDGFFQSIDQGTGFTSTVPRKEDGSFDGIAFYILTEELAKASGAISLCWTHRIHVSEDVSHMMSPEQKVYYAKYFEDARGGICGGITEPRGGSDVASTQTVATRKGDGWVINGRKIWISSANLAEIMFVVCKVVEEGKRDSLGIFLVRKEEGFQPSAPIPMLGLDKHPLCEVVFDNVEVPAIAKLQPADGAMGWTKWMFYGGRVMLSSISLGLAQAAFQHALAFSHVKEQFGRKLAGFQLMQELLADMATDIELGKLMVYKAADSLAHDTGNPTVESSMAKMFTTEMAVRVASNAIQLHGAMGLAVDTGVERIFRDARMLTIPDGPTQLHKLLIGRELTGVSALK